MFKGLRDKLKGALSSFTKGAEQEAQEEIIEEVQETAPEEVQEKVATPPKKSSPPKKDVEEVKKVSKTVSESQADTQPETTKETSAPTKDTTSESLAPAPSITQEELAEENAQSTEDEVVVEAPEKKSFLSSIKEKVTTIQLTEDKFDELFWDIELALLENNVAVQVIEKIKFDLKEELTTGRSARGGLKERVAGRMRETLTEVLDQEPLDLLKSSQEHKPLIIAIVGVNGSGKTTSIGKLGHYFQQHGKTVVFAAGDTFRAAAIQQLQEHAANLKVTCIAQSYGADPAAVAFDAIQHATAKQIDVVLIDTAGRLHSNTNLMDELAKVIRVAKPHHILFVGEAVTGNDCVEQARLFSTKVAVDGVILTKADVDEKGGAAVSVSHVTKKPIVFLGTGQGYEDFTPFDPQTIVNNLLGE